MSNREFTLQIETDNEAFGDDPGPELARILRNIADGLEQFGVGGHFAVHDANGNRVGSHSLTRTLGE